MKNIIIAGGNGFLGKQFADFLIQKKIIMFILLI